MEPEIRARSPKQAVHKQFSVSHPLIDGQSLEELEEKKPVDVVYLDDSKVLAIRLCLKGRQIKDIHKYLDTDILLNDLLRMALNDNVPVNYRLGAHGQIVDVVERLTPNQSTVDPSFVEPELDDIEADLLKKKDELRQSEKAEQAGSER